MINFNAVRAIYFYELNRWVRTILQSIATPVISTSLYVIVFGSAIGGRMMSIDGIPYGAYIIPGLILLTLLSESVANASFGIYLPRFSGTIYELLSAPVSVVEVILGYVGGAATKSVILGVVMLVTARIFVPFEILHPVAMVVYLILISVSFCLFGFILGIWAESFEQLQVVPLMIITPLTFLGGTFYSIKMLPHFWQGVVALNPIVYLVNGFRWTFFGIADVKIGMSLAMTLGFMALCTAFIAWLFKTGYRLRT
jgi:ABC-2 type transport system permease protein